MIVYNPRWKKTFDGRRFYWKTTLDGGQAFMEDNVLLKRDFEIPLFHVPPLRSSFSNASPYEIRLEKKLPWSLLSLESAQLSLCPLFCLVQPDCSNSLKMTF